MKFELKTENENYSKSFPTFLGISFIFALTTIFCDISIKLGIISVNYQIETNCRLLSIEKSKSNFDKLSRITNLKSKQKIWELCRQVVL